MKWTYFDAMRVWRSHRGDPKWEGHWLHQKPKLRDYINKDKLWKILFWVIILPGLGFWLFFVLFAIIFLTGALHLWV